MGEAGPGAASADSRINGKGRVALLYVALTLLLAYPLSLHPGSLATPGDPDTDLFMWTLAWDTHALVTRPLSIFDANIFHPFPHTLAYSENLIGSAFFAAPVLWLTGNPVLALNFVELLSVVLCGLGAYVLARRVGVGTAGAVLSGLVFAFAPSRFFRIGQLHLTTVQWVPFCLASLHAYLDGGRKRDLRLGLAFFTLQALTSGHGAVFLTLAVLALLVYRAAAGQPLAVKTRVRDLGATGAALILLVTLVFLPYRTVQVDMGLRRGLVDWAPSPQSFLASPTHVHRFLLSLAPDAHILERATGLLFPGYLPILLAAVALLWRGPKVASDTTSRQATFWTWLALLLEIAALACLAAGAIATMTGPVRLKLGSTVVLSVRSALRAWTLGALCVGLRIAILRRAPFAPRRRTRRAYGRLRGWIAARRHDAVTFYGLLTLLALWMTAPAPVGLWPFVHWLPGLNFIRVPARFMILATLGLAMLAGFGLDRLSARLTPTRRRLLAATAGALLVAECFAAPLYSRPYRVEIPAVDRWLDRQPKPFVVAELPVWDYARLHSTYMLHSMAHWQKTVHGYSGFLPPFHADLYSQMRDFPDEKSLGSLAALGVRYLVVHTELFPPGEWEEMRGRMEPFGAWLTLEYVDGAGRVYGLHPPHPDAPR